jgi:hypothetical protein
MRQESVWVPLASEPEVERPLGDQDGRAIFRIDEPDWQFGLVLLLNV